MWYDNPQGIPGIIDSNQTVYLIDRQITHNQRVYQIATLIRAYSRLRPNVLSGLRSQVIYFLPTEVFVFDEPMFYSA